MAIADVRSRTKSHPRAVTALLSIIGYALVALVFSGLLPFHHDLSRHTVVVLSDAIAVVNSVTLVCLLAGWRFIKRREIRRHRATMLTAFTLIMVFLVLYLTKVGFGFEKHLVAPEPVYAAYLAMLGVHLLLSVLAVPVVLYAVVLGLTHTPAELARTNHARVGRIAVAAWSISLALGLIVYLLLNHVYHWVPLNRSVLFFGVAGTRSLLRR